MVVPHFFPSYGGHEYYLARELAKLGHQVRMFTSDFLPVRYFRKPTKTLSGESRIDDGVSLMRIHAPLDLHGLPVFDPREAIVAFRPDVVCGTEFYHPATYLSYLAAVRAKVPFVFAQHMYEPPDGPRGMVWRGLSATVGSQIRAGSSQIIAISNAAKLLLLSLGVSEDKVAVIPLGVDIGLFHPRDDRFRRRREMGISESTVLLYVGRMEEVKGVSVLLRAFALLRREGRSVFLILVGDGDMRERYEQLSSRLGVSDSVKFTGSVKREDLPAYYDLSDIFVLPSLKEPFGLVGLEAMATGKPVVASRVGGIPDFVTEDSGILVRAGDFSGLAAALQSLLSNGDLRERMGEEGRRLVESKFQYSRVAERTVGVFQMALDRALPRINSVIAT